MVTGSAIRGILRSWRKRCPPGQSSDRGLARGARPEETRETRDRQPEGRLNRERCCGKLCSKLRGNGAREGFGARRPGSVRRDEEEDAREFGPPRRLPQEKPERYAGGACRRDP